MTTARKPHTGATRFSVRRATFLATCASAIVLIGLISISIVHGVQSTTLKQRVSSGDVPREWVTAAQVDPTAPAPQREQQVIEQSSMISTQLVPPQDSPDVAVTNAANTTQSENSVFVDPNNPQILLNSNNSSNWPVTLIFGADSWVSTDGGQTWSGSVLGPGGSNHGDPATSINLAGRMFVGYIANDWGNGISYSDSQGISWTQVQVAPGTGSSSYILDKNHLWVDNSASAYTGNLYAGWTNFQGGAADGEIEVRRSTTDGTSWGLSNNVSSAVAAGSHNQGVNIATGPGGEVYVVWAIYDSWPSNETALGMAVSTNGGLTFAPATRIITNIMGHRNTALGGFKTMRHNSFPSMAVNQQTGEVYVVWTNQGVPGVNVGDPDIYMISSADNGATWSTPTRVNQDTPGNSKDQWFPWISCDPVTGTLAVAFYDSRNSVINSMAETFCSVSTDDGATWEDFRVSDVAWSGDGIPGFSGNYAGDYIAIGGRNNTFYPMWTDTRAGNALVYVSPFTVGPTPTWTTITFDDFESGFGNYTDGGADCLLYTRGRLAWDGVNAADIQDNSGVASSFYHTIGYDVSGYTDQDIEFHFVAVGMEAGKSFDVQYYDGSGWVTLATFTSGTDFSNFTRYVATIGFSSSGVAFPVNAQLRFMCNAGDNRDDVYIDAIRWRGSSGVVTEAAGITIREVQKADEPGIATEDPGKVQPGIATVDQRIVTETALEQNLPNPFNPQTAVSFSLAEELHVRIDVFNVAGQLVTTLVDETRAAGRYSVPFNATGLTSGVYFYRMVAGDIVQTRKMVLLK